MRRPPSLRMPPLPPITKFLMFACTAVFCVQLLMQSTGVPLEYWLALWPLGSGRFMPWQPLTYGFLHGDFAHLFFNMLGLWMFGAELERLWGQRRYAHFLIASVAAAAIAQILFTMVIGTRAPTVGASGALFGLLMGYGMLFPNRTLMLLIPPIPMKARTFVIVFGAIELVFGVFGVTGIAHFAHLGGMLGGYLMIQYWRGKPPFSRKGPRRVR